MFHTSDTHGFLPTGCTVRWKEFKSKYHFLLLLSQPQFCEKIRCSCWNSWFRTDSAVETYESWKKSGSPIFASTAHFTKKHLAPWWTKPPLYLLCSGADFHFISTIWWSSCCEYSCWTYWGRKWLCCKVNEEEVSAYHARRFFCCCFRTANNAIPRSNVPLCSSAALKLFSFIHWWRPYRQFLPPLIWNDFCE